MEKTGLFSPEKSKRRAAGTHPASFPVSEVKVREFSPHQSLSVTLLTLGLYSTLATPRSSPCTHSTDGEGKIRHALSVAGIFSLGQGRVSPGRGFLCLLCLLASGEWDHPPRLHPCHPCQGQEDLASFNSSFLSTKRRIVPVCPYPRAPEVRREGLSPVSLCAQLPDCPHTSGSHLQNSLQGLFTEQAPATASFCYRNKREPRRTTLSCVHRGDNRTLDGLCLT